MTNHTQPNATGARHTPGPHRYDQHDRVIYGSESPAYSESTRIARIESGNHADGHLYAAATAMELLLHGVQMGIVGFYLPTGEVRFGGLMYSAGDRDWSKIVDLIGRDKLTAAIAKAQGGAS